MQGKKIYEPKMMYCIYLEELVSKDNFYRKLSEELDMQFLYGETEKYYGMEGQESIDPVVFFKICLVGYLNNINSDRKLIEYCGDSLAVRLFIQYDLDEPLPWHSTISRTRQLYGEGVFLSLFKKVLTMCIRKGMVRGKRQAIDSAYIKANASVDSMVEKELLEDAEQYAEELNQGSEFKITTRIQHKTTSNQTHYSPADPDARIATKPGKPGKLYYSGQIAVDDANHVITGAMADFSDKRDSQSLAPLLTQTINNMEMEDMQIEQIVADTNYSSGESLTYCKENNIDAHIPNIGAYRPTREGFIFNEKEDRYECQRGNKAFLPLIKVYQRTNHQPMKEYRSSRYACKNCPLRRECLGEKAKTKLIIHSIYKPLYDNMHKKMQTPYAKRLIRIRSATVEPVLGTLINFTSMKQVNTIGIQQANKHVLMATLVYNLKKYLRFTTTKANTKAQSIKQRIYKKQIKLKNYLLTMLFGAFLYRTRDIAP
jgi:transposase